MAIQTLGALDPGHRLYHKRRPQLFAQGCQYEPPRTVWDMPEVLDDEAKAFNNKVMFQSLPCTVYGLAPNSYATF